MAERRRKIVHDVAGGVLGVLIEAAVLLALAAAAILIAVVVSLVG